MKSWSTAARGRREAMQPQQTGAGGHTATGGRKSAACEKDNLLDSQRKTKQTNDNNNNNKTRARHCHWKDWDNQQVL